jgi:hypothetical protein
MGKLAFDLSRLAGVTGIAGALLFFFAGDTLFILALRTRFGTYCGNGGNREPCIGRRLFGGGLVGPLAAWMCIAGFGMCAFNIHPPHIAFKRTLFVLFSMLMVAASAGHTLWTARGLALKYCRDPSCQGLVTAIKSYWNLAYDLGALPGYIGAVLLPGLVLLGKTYYSRWTVVVNPAPLASRVPAPLGAVLVEALLTCRLRCSFGFQC